MPVDWSQEAPRLAKLARLALAPEETPVLALACEAITREFSALADYAQALPDAPPPGASALRADDPQPAPAHEVEAILRAAPAVDAATRKVIVPRGLP